MEQVARASKVTIKIPRPLYRRLAAIIEGTGFSSVTDFVIYVLRDIAATQRGMETPQLTKEEVEAVRARLRALGYL